MHIHTCTKKEIVLAGVDIANGHTLVQWLTKKS